MDDNVFRLNCECGCSNLDITNYDDQEVGLAYFVRADYADGNLWERIKVVWNVLTKGRYCLYEVIIPKERWQEFREFVNKLP